MELHLYSRPGVDGIEWILEAARSLLAGARRPLVAYLPLASLHRRWIRETKGYFRGLAAVQAIDPQLHAPEQVLETLDRADLFYIPGGNTYWLTYQLSQPLGGGPTLLSELRRRILDGKPLLAFSAGAVLCGPDILTTNDINPNAGVCFGGLDLLPFSINAHFPPAGDPAGREARLARLDEFLHFHPRRTVLGLEDDAYLQVSGGEIHAARGHIWQITRGQEPRLLLS
ncbi:MAG: Type 1 glutamine amidotransferase-like domain-containing protein [Chloroflexota bacterium]